MKEAEDAVQDTWLRYAAADVQPRSTKAYLSAIVTRLSLDTLPSARVRREEYIGEWFPEPLIDDPYEDPERAAEVRRRPRAARAAGHVVLRRAPRR